MKLKKDLHLLYANGKAIIASDNYEELRGKMEALEEIDSVINSWGAGDTIDLDLLGDLSNINNLRDFIEGESDV